jgi:hypothetical protein
MSLYVLTYRVQFSRIRDFTPATTFWQILWFTGDKTSENVYAL